MAQERGLAGPEETELELDDELEDEAEVESLIDSTDL